MQHKLQQFRTKGAAEYCTAQGLKRSSSYLEAARQRGPEDPRDHGPEFTRDSHGFCWYSVQDLDAYIEQQLAARRRRAPLQQPAQLRQQGS